MYYGTAYEFPFLFEYEEDFKKKVESCYLKYDMENNEIIPECIELCKSYKFGAISKHIFGFSQFLKKINSFYGPQLKVVKKR